MRAVITALFLATVLVPPVAAAETAPAAEEGFSLQPATGDYLKVDRNSGSVSLCSARAGVWSCQLIPDDRLAYEERIAELEADNGRLEKRVAELEARAGGDRKPLFDQEDERRLQRFLDLSDRMFRHFFDFARSLRDPEDKPI